MKRVLCVVALSIAAALGAAAHAGEIAGTWTPAPAAPEFDGFYEDIAVRGDTLVICGTFAHVGAVLTGPVALWNGMRWTSLAQSDVWLPDEVRHVFALPGGGWAAIAVSRSGEHVWVVRGNRWVALPGAFDDHVHAMTRYRGDLLAAGRFTHIGTDSLPFLARWDGTQWRSFGGDSTVALSGITTMAVMHDTLHVAREIASSDDSVSVFALWDGAQWTFLADHRRNAGYFWPRFVQAGNRLYLNNCTDTRVAFFDGTAWTDVEVPRSSERNRFVAADSTHLFLVGATLSEWDGREWRPRAMPSLNFILRQAVVAGGRVVCIEGSAVWEPRAGRRVSLIDGDGPPTGATAIATLNSTIFYVGRSTHLMRSTGSHWVTDEDANASCLAVHDGEMWAGGTFPTADGPRPTLAHFAGADGAPRLDVRWRPWGAVLPDTPAAFTWFAGRPVVAVWEGDSARVVQAGENRWDTMGIPLNIEVSSLHVYHGVLYAAGGRARVSQNRSFPALYAWRDGAWMPVPDGPFGTIRALCEYRDTLAVGGGFALGATRDAVIGFWDGTRWDASRTVADSSRGGTQVYALAEYHNTLIVGGSLRLPGLGTDGDGVARLAGHTWTTLASGPHGSVHVLAVDGDRLIAGIDRYFSIDGGTVGVQFWRDGPARFATSVHPRIRPVLASRSGEPARIHYVADRLSMVQLTAFDIRGRRLAIIQHADAERGEHDVKWDMRDESGRLIAPGVYVLQLELDGVAFHQRMVVLR